MNDKDVYDLFQKAMRAFRSDLTTEMKVKRRRELIISESLSMLEALSEALKSRIEDVNPSIIESGIDVIVENIAYIFHEQLNVEKKVAENTQTITIKYQDEKLASFEAVRVEK